MGTQTDNEYKPTWYIIGRSVRGASHQRSGMPNQDAIQFASIPESQTAILAISDGHGSERYFRSHLGSQYAVEIAVAEMRQFVHEVAVKDVSGIRQLAKGLPKRIVTKWREKVIAHLDALPFFTEEEWEHFNNGSSLPTLERNPTAPYGATLLAVLVTEKFIYCLQLGDGDIVFVRANGKPVKPIEDDKRLLANYTTSLCTSTAVQDFRQKFYQRENTPPTLITLSTDGYANSFTTYQGFLKVGTDILKMLHEENGLSKVEESLPEWLASATNEGSGDDITYGAICYLPALELPFPATELAPVEVAKEIPL
jgi:serine/threonine protein phosphatase PrpC